MINSGWQDFSHQLPLNDFPSCDSCRIEFQTVSLILGCSFIDAKVNILSDTFFPFSVWAINQSEFQDYLSWQKKNPFKFTHFFYKFEHFLSVPWIEMECFKIQLIINVESLLVREYSQSRTVHRFKVALESGYGESG